MKFNLIHVFTLFSVVLVISTHAMTPEVYWKSVLPKSPMPKSIKDLLNTTTEWNDENSIAVGTGKGGVAVLTGLKSVDLINNHASPENVLIYNHASPENVLIYNHAITETELKYNPNLAFFFLEKNLHQGKEVNLRFTKNNQKATFLPRKIAELIPFSSNNLPEIYNMFSIKPNSMEAKITKQTLNECENKGIEGEEKYCATSLESMVDFTTTKLGKKVKVISTQVNAKKSTLLQKYKIELVKKLAANKVVACHKQNYMYAVFYCHKIVSTRAYVVSLVGADGAKVNAVAVCHSDTAKWDPKHLAFQVLKVKPGSVPICHFFPGDHVVWVPY